MTKPRRPRPSGDSHTWLYLIGQPGVSGRPATIKVGVTSNPKSRMRQHASYSPLLWQHYSASGPRDLVLEMERAAIRALSEAGTRLAPMGEEFYGLVKAQAVGLVRAAVVHVRANSQEIRASRSRYVTSIAEWRKHRAALEAATRVA